MSIPVVTVVLQEGFCNRMSQYAFARAYAEKHGCQLQTNKWMGQEVFQLDDPPIERDLPWRVMEELEQWDGQTDIKISGWGQHQKCLLYSREDARRWFAFRPEILDLLKSVPRYEVAAHLRWGDFIGMGGFIAISKESYLNACDKFGIDRARLRFISEEEPIVVPEIPAGGFQHTRGEDTQRTQLGFLPDFYALMQADILFRACSTFSLWAAILGNHKRVFSPDLRGIPWEGTGRGLQDVPFIEGNHMPITCHWHGHSELHLRESSFMSNSQAAQDEFVHELIVRPERKRDGVFLDIGAGYPVQINNTYALEQIGWRGLLVDSSADCIKYAAQQRACEAVCADATKFVYPAKYKSVDYLSLDVDRDEVDALRNLLEQGVRFRVATIEHSSYCYGPVPRDEIRTLLHEAGYVALCRDVSYDGNVFEDWWIDPKRVELHIAARFVSVGLDGATIVRRGRTHRFCGFNGQLYRQLIFAQLMAAVKTTHIIETGTCNGETTGYMAEISGLPVVTCEINPTWETAAKKRIAGMNVEICGGDSRALLKDFVKRGMAAHRTFFYLDAHWGPELPLAEEIEIIASHWNEFVILIDDFRVPDDGGYGFDDYGGTNVIGPELIRDVVDRHRLCTFLPDVAAGLETGARRGSAILCRRGEIENTLCDVPLIRRWVSALQPATSA